jgi:hypothetical protein
MSLEPLGSERFFQTMARLKEAGAHELYALKGESWMEKSAQLLGLQPTETTIGYADKVTDDIERLNFSLVAKVQSGVAPEIVAGYMRDIVTLPGVDKDKDYQTLASGLMRAAHMFQQVKEDYPGLEDSWEKFFTDRRKAVFEHFAEMVDESDVDRKKLFEALSSIVGGHVPAELREFEDDLQRAHEQFYGGQADELSDTLYGLTAAILDRKTPDPEESEDPFGDLGRYAAQNDVNAPAPPSLGDSDPFKPPDPINLDLDKLGDLREMEVDLVFPEGETGTGYLTFKVPHAPGAQLAYQANVATMHEQIRRLRQIIEEYYRTATITDHGLKTGRVDASRVHRLNYGVSNVFKRHTVDSVGHAEVVVLIDESGSMGSHMDLGGVKQPDYRGLPKGPSAARSGDNSCFLGKSVTSPQGNRTNVAMRMALMLLEVSRALPGFRVEVVGYSTVGTSLLGSLEEPAKALAGKQKYFYGAPVVRRLGTTEDPYAIVSAVPMQENADFQAMHYAVDRLNQSSAPQRAILYLADGQIHDEADAFANVLKRSQRMGITTFFMNLMGQAPFDGSMLADLDRQDVNDFDDMVTGLKRFLHKMVLQIA